MTLASNDLFSYREALAGAQTITSILSPFCKRVEICGGLRRESPEVHDIDIVCQDTDRFSLITALVQVVESMKPTADKITFRYLGIPGEIFFVNNVREFEVVKLVRTGDHAFTKSLAMNALDRGYMLKFSVDEGYYKIPMYGLYPISGKYFTVDKSGDKHKHYYTQDMLHPIAYKENDIILFLYGKEIHPSERNWGSSGGTTGRQDQSALQE